MRSRFSKCILRVVTFVLAFALILNITPLDVMAKTITEDWELITPGSSGIGGDSNSEQPHISDDGRYIVFRSSATDLIPGKTTNSNTNIYIYDSVNKTTKLITAGPSGLGGDGDSRNSQISISGDGSKVVFFSRATDLISGSTSTNDGDIYIYDVASETLSRLAPHLPQLRGVWGLGISYDGSKVAFDSFEESLISGITTTGTNIFLYDIPAATMTLASKGPGGTGPDGGTQNPTISPDGRYVVFQSWASDLVGGITTNYNQNVYLYDAQTDSVALITKGPSGTGIDHGGNNGHFGVVSADSSFVVFTSWASDVISSGTTPSINNLYRYDIATEQVTLLTAGPSGVGGDNSSYGPSISADGKTIGFISMATDLIPGVTLSGSMQAYALDVTTGIIRLISAGASGLGGVTLSWNQWSNSHRPVFSADASVTAFHSYAIDLVPGLETNGIGQIYTLTRTTFCDFTFDPGNDSATFTQNDMVRCQATRPTDLIRPGYIFTGWWTAPTGGTLWNFSDRADDDITLYAQWAVAPGAPNTGVMSESIAPITLFITLVAVIAGTVLIKRRDII